MNKATTADGGTLTIQPRSRGERGTGSTITIDLSEYPKLLTAIREAAKKDDREPSKWLRRRLIQLETQLLNLAPEHPHN